MKDISVHQCVSTVRDESCFYALRLYLEGFLCEYGKVTKCEELFQAPPVLEVKVQLIFPIDNVT